MTGSLPGSHGAIPRFVLHDACLDDVVHGDPALTGVGCVEVDVARTLDGRLLVLPCAAVLDKGAALRAVATHGRRDLSEDVFRPVDEVVDLVTGLGLAVVLDLKATVAEEAFFGEIIGMLPRSPSVFLASYNHRVIREAARRCGSAACGIVFAGLPTDIGQLAYAAGASWVVMQGRFLSRELCGELRGRGVGTMTFSASSPERLREALDTDADSIMVECAVLGHLTEAGRL